MAKKEKKVKPPKEKKVRKPEYTESGGLDYSVYYMKPLERAGYILAAGAVLFVLGWIFYRSVPFCLIMALGGLFYPKIRTEQIIKKRRQQLNLQFKDMLYSLSSAIGAGASVERAMVSTLHDMEQQYGGADVHIVKELELIVSKLEMNQNIEAIFADLGDRSGIEDIRTFSSIFEISKRTGGNLIQIIRQTSAVIAEKIETKTEMETIMAAKKMEQKVMTLMPIGLVFLLTETTGDFMESLFTSLVGRGVATVGLVLVIIGYLWGNKISDIEV